MIKEMIQDTDFGWVVNKTEGTLHPKPSKEILPELIFGCGLIAVGLITVIRASFVNGARAFETAEYETLDRLGYLK